MSKWMKWQAPVDPRCPVVKSFHRNLDEDPLTGAMGAPVDDIVDLFERRHRAKCDRCQAFGAANIEVEVR